MKTADAALSGVMALAVAVWGVTGPAKADPAMIRPAGTPPQGDVVAFCKAHPTVDFPDALFLGRDHKPDELPHQISALEASKWRCMDGRVLVCLDSADGDACSIKDPSRTPSQAIRETCRDQPDSPFIDFATGHYSAFDWRCRGGKPLIVRGYPIDRRGFFKAAWKPVIVRHGVVVGPTDLPGAPR